MIASAFLLAQTGQVSLDKNEYWLVAVAVAATFIALFALLGAWALIRRQPSIEREIDDRIGAAMVPMEARWEKRCTECSNHHRDAVAGAEKRWDAKLTDFHEEMIRLDRDHAGTMASLFQKLDDTRREAKDDYGQLAQSINKSFQELNLHIGRLEGQLKG